MDFLSYENQNTKNAVCKAVDHKMSINAIDKALESIIMILIKKVKQLCIPRSICF